MSNTLPLSYPTFDNVACYNFFLSRPWFENLIETVIKPDNNCAKFISVVSPDKDVDYDGLLPLYIKPDELSWWRPRTVQSLSNYYTSLYAPIVAQETACDAVTKRLIKSLIQEHPAWDMVDFHPLDSDAPTTIALQAALRQFGWITQAYFCFGNWYLPCANLRSKDYLETRPSQLRNTLKRKEKKFLSTHGAKIEIFQSGQNLENAISAFNAVYQRSWKKPEPYPKFIAGLIRTCERMGWLRMGIAWLDGRPIAAQLWIVCGNTASIYKLAYDDEFKSLSAGSILTWHLMRHVLDIDQVSEVDYLTGDDPYKKEWMSLRRERIGIRAFNPYRFMGLTHAAYHISGRFFKKLLSKTCSS